MIAPTKAWTTSSGLVFASREEAQKAEINELLRRELPPMSETPDVVKAVTELIVANQKILIDLFTTTEASRPTRRKVNGYPGHKRGLPKPQTEATDAPA